MAELPEISKITSQMNKELAGKTFFRIIVNQPKCLNMGCEDIERNCIGISISKVTHIGKWICIALCNSYYILISLGMGGDILYKTNSLDLKNEKYHIIIQFTDGSGFVIRFYWFGKFHFTKNLEAHSQTKNIAPSPFDVSFNYESFKKIFQNRRRSIKSILLDQTMISGVGNMYVHDILFLAKLHPGSIAKHLQDDEIENLYRSILYVLNNSKSKETFAYEKDFYGNYGKYNTNNFIVAYRNDEKCPNCGKKIEKIKIGNTSSYICSNCQVKK